MDAQRINRLERLLERELSTKEKERLRRIQDVLGIKSDDGIWDVLIAMEYQRNYYDELPEKISSAAAEIINNLSQAAENEVTKAQGRLAESVVKQAEKLSLKTHVNTWIMWGVFALVLLLLYGGLLLWAGYGMGSGQTQPPALILRMPVGAIVGALGLSGGIFLGVMAAREFAEGHAQWRKRLLVALGCLVSGGVIFSLAV